MRPDRAQNPNMNQAFLKRIIFLLLPAEVSDQHLEQPWSVMQLEMEVSVRITTEANPNTAQCQEVWANLWSGDLLWTNIR